MASCMILYSFLSLSVLSNRKTISLAAREDKIPVRAGIIIFMGTGSGNLDATLNPAVNAANPTIDLVMEAVNSFHDILLSMNLMKSGTVLINISVVFTMIFVLKNFITTFLAAAPVTCFSQITAANLWIVSFPKA